MLRTMIAAGVGLVASAAAAAACDVDYVLQDDDDLLTISDVAYGANRSQLILARNPTLATRLNDLPAGETVVLPCLPGVAEMQPDRAALEARMAGERPAPAVAAAAPAAALEPETTEPAEQAPRLVATRSATPTDVAATATAPAPAATSAGSQPARTTSRAFRLLTADGQAPFAEEAAPEGGMVTALLTAALAGSASAPEARIVFVNDRGAHLRDLLLDGSFDVGFPWFRPACEAEDDLAARDAEGAWFCESFHFSAPIYEFVNGVFVEADGSRANVRSFADLAESRICRPAGGAMDDMEVRGVSPPDATFLRPETADDCFRMLAAGEADAVSMEVFAAESAIDRVGLSGDVVEIIELDVVRTLHAVAPKTKPEAVALLAETDRALEAMKLSGEWFRVVRRHLARN